MENEKGITIKPVKTVSVEDAFELLVKLLKEEQANNTKLQNRLEKAEKSLRFYGYDKMFKRIYKMFPNFGKRAREYFDKHGKGEEG